MATSATDEFVFGQKDVAAAGTAVQLDATAYRLQSLMLIAHSDNVGRIFYGGSGVDSDTQKGLAPGESITITGVRGMLLTSIYIDSANNNDGVDFIGVLRP